MHVHVHIDIISVCIHISKFTDVLHDTVIYEKGKGFRGGGSIYTNMYIYMYIYTYINYIVLAVVRSWAE